MLIVESDNLLSHFHSVKQIFLKLLIASFKKYLVCRNLHIVKFSQFHLPFDKCVKGNLFLKHSY